MFIEEAVAMRGAEARRQTATELRMQASQFIDLKQAIKYATEQKDDLTRKLPVCREILPSRREDLAAMRDKEPKIRDNKVVIYPVR